MFKIVLEDRVTKADTQRTDQSTYKVTERAGFANFKSFVSSFFILVLFVRVLIVDYIPNQSDVYYQGCVGCAKPSQLISPCVRLP